MIRAWRVLAAPRSSESEIPSLTSFRRPTPLRRQAALDRGASLRLTSGCSDAASEPAARPDCRARRQRREFPEALVIALKGRALRGLGLRRHDCATFRMCAISASASCFNRSTLGSSSLSRSARCASHSSSVPNGHGLGLSVNPGPGADLSPSPAPSSLSISLSLSSPLPIYALAAGPRTEAGVWQAL
jgi:hypothetical protein